jgi:hypothetical protein
MYPAGAPVGSFPDGAVEVEDEEADTAELAPGATGTVTATLSPAAAAGSAVNGTLVCLATSHGAGDRDRTGMTSLEGCGSQRLNCCGPGQGVCRSRRE